MLLSLLAYSLMIGGSIVYVLYCLKPVNNGPLADFRTFMLKTLPNTISRAGDRVFGPRFTTSIVALNNYVFFTNNPIIMIFYVLVGPGSYLLYMHEIMIGYYGYFDPFHLLTGNTLAMFAFFMYYKTYATKPGRITVENEKAYSEKYKTHEDGYIFRSGEICTTCKVLK